MYIIFSHTSKTKHYPGFIFDEMKLASWPNTFPSTLYKREVAKMPSSYMKHFKLFWKTDQCMPYLHTYTLLLLLLLSHFSRVQLTDGSPPGSLIPGILQARTLEWVAISFSSAGKWKVKVKSLSCVWLFETPWTAAYQAPPSMGFSRQEYWSGVPLPPPTHIHFRV